MIRSFPRATGTICSWLLVKNSDCELFAPVANYEKATGAKSDGSKSLLGIKIGKNVKKCQKYVENNKKI